MRICLILVAGLDGSLLARAGALPTLGSFKRTVPLQPVWPAVTCTMQATLTTGVAADRHGIIANGLYTHGRSDLHGKLDLTNTADFRQDVSFWEQSNALLETPRFWTRTGARKKVAMLFWQNSMHGAADIVLTPKPEHTPDGKTLTACWAQPRELYAELTARLGPFPLQHYWSPLAALPSSQWIIAAAIDVWQRHTPDLQLVYVPHMDYNLLRLGPGNPAVLKDLAAVDAEIGKLVAAVRESGGVPIIAGDYAMSDVHTCGLPNRALREAGLLVTRPDAQGKLLVDYDRSTAFAMVDHQVAHVYTRPERRGEVAAVLRNVPGVARVLAAQAEIEALGLHHPRSGNILLLAQPHAWFAHDWWRADAEKPAWQFGVDIHRKPGFDPRELFFDPARKCIAQDVALVKGSHGLVSENPAAWPVVLCDTPAPATLHATEFAGWLDGIRSDE